MGTPAASSTVRAASVISGPMPSPGMRVTVCIGDVMYGKKKSRTMRGHGAKAPLPAPGKFEGEGLQRAGEQRGHSPCVPVVAVHVAQELQGVVACRPGDLAETAIVGGRLLCGWKIQPKEGVAEVLREKQALRHESVMLASLHAGDVEAPFFQIPFDMTQSGTGNSRCAERNRLSFQCAV